METINGNITSVTSRHDGSGYTIICFRHDGEVSRLRAFLPDMPRAGERFCAVGGWTDHPHYGRQFAAKEFVSIAPNSNEEIEAFLASGLFPGVGAQLAKRMVTLFGTATLDIIETEPKKLRYVTGIGAAKALGIVDAWKSHRDLRALSLFLARFGFSLSLAGRVFHQWGKDALKRVQEEPYSFYRRFAGAGFNLVDRMALLELGTTHIAWARCEAGVLEAMSRTFNDGHTCLPRAVIVERASDLLNVHPAHVTEAINRMLTCADLVEDDIGGKPLVYLPALKRAEEDIATRLAQLSSSPAILTRYAAHDAVRLLAAHLSFELSSSQVRAIQTILSNPVTTLTGGPGSGKTCITQVLCAAATAARIPIHLGAPTGRAAQRLEELTQNPASTIHRLLTFNPALDRFQRDASSPLPRGLVLIDEASMLDVPLAAHLLRAIEAGSQVVFVGDVDQLPPVGPGTFLRDVICAFPAATARLTEIHRQSEGSWIIRNAHRILKGEAMEYPPKGTKVDIHFRGAGGPENVVEHLGKILANLKSKGVDLQADVQILTPTRKGLLGSVALNKYLQNALNPENGGGPVAEGFRFRTGDRVIQKSNDYEREIFNGNLGSVVRIDREQRLLWIEFSNRTHEFAFNDLESIELAYAVTIYKAQGSEYPIVIAVVHNSHGVMLTRQLLYTAVTRARRFLLILGNSEAVEIATANSQFATRHSALLPRLHAVAHPQLGQRATA